MKMPLKLCVLLWVSISLMALFPLLLHVDNGAYVELSEVGLFLFLAWFVAFYMHKEKRLPYDKHKDAHHYYQPSERSEDYIQRNIDHGIVDPNKFIHF